MNAIPVGVQESLSVIHVQVPASISVTRAMAQEARDSLKMPEYVVAAGVLGSLTVEHAAELAHKHAADAMAMVIHHASSVAAQGSILLPSRDTRICPMKQL